MCIEESKKIICEIYDGTIYSRDEDTVIFESSEIG
jgi:hypothetical protein